MSDVVARVPFVFAETDWLHATPDVGRFSLRGDEAVRLAAASVFGDGLAPGDQHLLFFENSGGRSRLGCHCHDSFLLSLALKRPGLRRRP